MKVFGGVKEKVILTGFYPHNGHRIKEDFGVLLTQGTTEGKQDAKVLTMAPGRRKIQLVSLSFAHSPFFAPTGSIQKQPVNVNTIFGTNVGLIDRENLRNK